LWQEWVESTGGGYSYSTLCRRYKDWGKQHRVTLRHEYRGGEKLITDFAGEGLRYRLGDGTTKAVQIFVAVLGASSRIYCEALDSQRIMPWIGAHTRAFEFFGGVTDAVIIDNLKSGVTKVDRYEPELTRAVEEWAAHYGVTAMPTRAGKPRDKGKVEKAVQDVERWVLAPLRHVDFSSLAAINQAMRVRLAALNAPQMQDYECSRDELFEKFDKPALRKLPAVPFEIAE
jgi:transposase